MHGSKELVDLTDIWYWDTITNRFVNWSAFVLFMVRRVYNLRGWVPKAPSPLFFVENGNANRSGL